MHVIIEQTEQPSFEASEERTSKRASTAAAPAWAACFFRPNSLAKSVMAEMKKDGAIQWKATALD